MRSALVVLCVHVCGAAGAWSLAPERRGGARAWGPACALLDAAGRADCSCAVFAARWALTAAHCATRGPTHVQYDGRDPSRSTAAVSRSYVHPEYYAAWQDAGLGAEVVLLWHDVGLVRTRADMALRAGAGPRDPVAALARYDVNDLMGQEVDVLGFGMAAHRRWRWPVRERLRGVRLRLAACEYAGWQHCACAAGANAATVCSGDSGGPVLYNGTLIGVTSMGALECEAEPAPARACEVRSVFTALRPYAAVINNTLRNKPLAFRMREVRAAARALAPPRLSLAALALSLAKLVARS